ncbi:hypothetical protein [Halococcoides cellulosivorans]|nr:hypothetical protein [Halococcoides cellulosivorans]
MDRVGDAYMGAKRAQHREALAAGDWLRYAWLWLQKWTIGYGERPWRLVAASILGIAFFGVLYPIVGQIDLTDGPENLIGAGYLSAAAGLVPDTVASAPLAETLAHWGSVLLTSLYFSTVTFTRLGGHPAPRRGGEGARRDRVVRRGGRARAVRLRAGADDDAVGLRAKSFGGPRSDRSGGLNASGRSSRRWRTSDRCGCWCRGVRGGLDRGGAARQEDDREEREGAFHGGGVGRW